MGIRILLRGSQIAAIMPDLGTIKTNNGDLT